MAQLICYALYSDAATSQVWVDVWEKHSSGHWVRSNNDELLVFNDVAAARETLKTVCPKKSFFSWFGIGG
jgi:hypothetical protein